MSRKLIYGGTVVSPAGKKEADLLIENGKILAVEAGLKDQDAGKAGDTELIDARGMLVLPGIIDAHTHYHLESRGTVTADSFFEGSRAASFGGVTTVIDFADQEAGQSLQEASGERIKAMSEGMACDFALHQSVYTMHDAIPEELEALKKMGVRTVKIFTTYKREGYLIEKAGLQTLFGHCRDLELMVTVHAEDNDLIEELELKYEGEPLPPSMHPVLRPSESEYLAVKYIGELAHSTGMPIYIVHLSSARGYDAVRELKAAGANIMVETTPHYLLLNNDLLEGPEAQKYIMTPPLRRPEDNGALWRGVEAGDIEIIATDHCSFTAEQKLSSDSVLTILPGIPGSEELFPLVHTEGVGKGRFGIEKLVSLLCEMPAKAFGLYPRKGTLAAGSDADLVIFDPRKKCVFSDESQHTAAGYTPYRGWKIEGMAVTTLIRGEVVMDKGTYFGKAGTGLFIEAGVPEIYRRS
jgi:dihydropyrimidinase